MSDKVTSGCKAKVGLLFLRDCDRPVFEQCAQCGRPVCKTHRVKCEEGSLCTECAGQKEKYHDRPAVSRSYRRQHYYNDHSYYPYYYGSHRYYSDHDYRTFDDREQIVTEPEGDGGFGDEADFDTADDFMES